MRKPINKTPPIFDYSNDSLPLSEDMISFHAINPFVPHNSSARAYMASSHISQAITLDNGDEKLIQSGIEKQLADNTFSCKIENDSRILAIIKRYDGIDKSSVNKTTEYLVIFQDLVTEEVDYLSVPYSFGLHQYFGFKYNWDQAILDNTYIGTIIKGGTILADSPAVDKRGAYKYGINANTVLLTLPEVAEDGFIISKSCSKKLSYKIFEKRTVEYGEDSYPLNMYGDETHYKPFPDIGEYINDDSIVMALRSYEPELSASLTSVKDTMRFDPQFDEAVYVNKPGGKVVDIVAYYSPKNRRGSYTGVHDNILKYTNGTTTFYNKIIQTYESLEADLKSRSHSATLKISDKFNNLLVQAYALVNPDDHRIRRTYKKDALDLYRIEFTVEYTIEPKIGSKLTDLSGGKGVVVGVWPDEDMPISKDGIRADIIGDPTSVASRMNLAKLYEQYINGAIVKVDTNIKRMLAEGKDRGYVWEYLLDFIALFETEQYEAYKNLEQADINQVLDYIEKDLLVVYYRVSSSKRAYQIVNDIRQTEYAPTIDKILIKSDGGFKESVDNILIAPLYTLLLSKTADTFLSTSSAKTNHYGMPVAVGKVEKHGVSHRNNPVRVLGETEGRLFVGYVSRGFVAEFKDRASSLTTHAHVYKNILDAPKPTSIKRLVDREAIPFGGDNALLFTKSIVNCAGLDFKYVPEKN